VMVNTIRDLHFRMMMTRAARPLSAIPDYPRALYSVFMGDQNYLNWLKSRGSMGGFLTSSWESLKSAREGMHISDIPSQVRHPFLTAKATYRKVGELSEYPNRLAEYQRVLKEKFRKLGNLKEARTLASLASRQSTVDFGRRGSSRNIQIANQMTAFLNPALQGVDAAARAIRYRPKEIMQRGMSLITLPYMTLYYINRKNPYYKKESDYQRNAYLLIPTNLSKATENAYREFKGEKVTEEDWKECREFLRIPQVHSFMFVFGGIPRLIAESMDKTNPRAFEDFLKKAQIDLMPPLMPDFIDAISLPMTRFDSFKGQPVETLQEQEMLPYARVGPTTSQLAESLGYWTRCMKEYGLSPKMIDAEMTNLFGGSWDVAAGISGAVGSFAKEKGAFQGQPIFERNPSQGKSSIYGRFYRPYMGVDVPEARDYYKSRKLSRSALSTLKERGEKGYVKEIQELAPMASPSDVFKESEKYMKQIREALQYWETMPDSEQKQNQIIQLNELMGSIQKLTNKTIKTIPTQSDTVNQLRGE
jgi:hypothetical protein